MWVNYELKPKCLHIKNKRFFYHDRMALPLAKKVQKSARLAISKKSTRVKNFHAINVT